MTYSSPFFTISTFPSLISALFFILIFSSCNAQETGRNRVMFYNVENLFDTVNDTLIRDEEFLPDGEKKWSNDKFYTKLNHIYKVMISCGEWDPPAIVGLCEIENRFVLEKLIYNTPLKKFDYRICHYDSPDERGIDVALIYRKAYFTPDTSYPISVRFPFEPGNKTRDILYVKGVIGSGETLHIFVNHWPSRYGGYQATAPNRNYCAQVLRNSVDSVCKNDSSARILIMGDFNDGPYDESLKNHLGAAVDSFSLSKDGLVNLSAIFDREEHVGTLKYKENWDVFDQLIVSGNLLNDTAGLYVTKQEANIHNPDFLFMEDEKYLGIRPFRTYLGFRYIGGYSDHLPVYLDLKVKEEKIHESN